MRALLMLTMVVLAACGSKKDKASKHEKTARDLTLRLAERTVKDRLRTYLQLCVDDKCHNALQERNGAEFYFPNQISDRRNDHRLLHTRKGREDSRSDRRPVNQHRGGYERAPRVEAVFTLGGLRLSYSQRVRTAYRTHVVYNNRTSDRIRNMDRHQTGGRRAERKDNGDYANALSTTAVHPNLMQVIADNRHWEEREHSLRQLFVDGKKITVSKKELHRLLTITADYFDVAINRAVAKLLNRS